jgi:hypothetical protein
MKRGPLVGTGIVAVLAGLAAAGVLRSGGDPPAGLQVLGGPVDVAAAEDADTGLLDRFSKPASQVFVLEAGGGPSHYELRFAVPDDFSDDPSRLVAASREEDGAMWALTEGQVARDHLIIQSNHLSWWQLRILDRGIPPPSRAIVERMLGLRAKPPECGSLPDGLELEVRDESGILLGPCIELDPGPTLSVANNRAVSLAFEVPAGSRVKLSSPSLSERAYDSIYRLLPGDGSRLLPGAGTGSISIPILPTELRFRVDRGAAILDAAVALVTRGKGQEAGTRALKTIECLHAQYGTVTDDKIADRDDFVSAVAKLIGKCAKPIGTALGARRLADIGFALSLAKLGYSAWDAVRTLGHAAAKIRVGTLPSRLMSPKPDPATLARVGTSCGVVEEVVAETGVGVALELGVTKGAVRCGGIEAAVRAYLDASGPCAQRGAGTCWRQVGRWFCVAPTYSLYPTGVACEDGELGQRIVGLHRTVIGAGPERSCGTSPLAEIPGPFDVFANFDCEAAHRIAGGLFTPRLYPYACRIRQTGIESSTHSCAFGDSRVSFSTGA